MTHFITTNEVAVAAVLGVLLVACAVLLQMSVARRIRERRAARRLLELVEIEGRYSCEDVTSRFVHDLNNLILALSMESERFESADGGNSERLQHADILQQVVADGRSIVERCRARAVPAGLSVSNLRQELQAATELMNDAGYCNVDVARPSGVSAAVTVARPATDVHLLVLSMVRAAQAGSRRNPLTLTMAAGRACPYAEDGNASDWVSVSIGGSGPLADNDARIVMLSRIARRLSGEVAYSEAADGRDRIVVSVPVARR